MRVAAQNVWRLLFLSGAVFGNKMTVCIYALMCFVL